MIWSRAFFLVLLLLGSAFRVVADEALMRIEPGAEAAAAFMSFEAGQRAEACEALADQLRQGSSDPWAYRGAALCAKQVDGFRGSFETLLGDPGDAGALEGWGRAYLAFLDERYTEAEGELRSTIGLEPRFPLAWNLLGVVLERREEYEQAIAAYDRCLEIASDFSLPRSNLRRLTSQRLAALVPDLQEVHGGLAEARGAAWDIEPTEVLTNLDKQGLDGFTVQALETARDLLMRVQKRLGEASAWLEQGKLMLALGLPDRAQSALGRARKLFEEEDDVAGIAACLSEEERALVQIESRDGAVYGRLYRWFTEVAETWHELPKSSVPYSNQDPLSILSDVDLTARLGDYQEVRRHLTRLIVASPPEREQLATEWAGAEVFDEVELWLPALLIEGELASEPVAFALALEAWMALGRATSRQDLLLHGARLALELLSEQAGAAMALELSRTWEDVAVTTGGFLRLRARILTSVGEVRVDGERHENALGPYRTARELFGAIPDTRGETLSYLEEAHILFRLERLTEALPVYEQVVSLGEAHGDPEMVASGLLGKAQVTARLGLEGAPVDEIRQARNLFVRAGDSLGQASAWRAEGQALTRGGEHEAALDAYSRAGELYRSAEEPAEEAGNLLEQGEVFRRAGDRESAIAAAQQARKLYERIGDSKGSADAVRLEGELLGWFGDPTAALSRYEEAQDLYQAVGDSEGLVALWKGEVRALIALAKDEDEGRGFRRIRAVAGASGDSKREAQTWLAQFNVDLERGDRKSAQRALRKAHKLFERIDDQQGLGWTIRSESVVLHLSGRLEEALKTVERARTLFRRCKDRGGEAESWYEAAELLASLGDGASALEAVREARRLFASRGTVTLGRGSEAGTWNIEGQLLARRGDNEAGLEAVQRGRTLARSEGLQSVEAMAWLIEADTLTQLGHGADALEAVQEARRITQESDNEALLGWSWLLEGQVRSRTGAKREALAAAIRAKKLFERAGTVSDAAQASWLEGEVLLALGETALGIEALEEAQSLLEDTEDHFSRSNVSLSQAYILLSEGELEEVVSVALESARTFGSSSIAKPNEREALELAAQAYLRLGETEKAVELALKALDAHREVRSTRIMADQRLLVDQYIHTAYDVLVTGLLSLGRVEESLSWAERARARSLLDLLSAEESTSDAVLAEQAGEEERLRETLAENESEREKAQDREERRILDQERARMLNALDRKRYERLADSPRKLALAEPLDAEGIRALASATGPLILFYTTATEVIGFVVRGESPLTAMTIPIEQAVLQKRIDGFAHALANPLFEERAVAIADELWRELIGPLVAELPEGGPLTILPHGPLHQLAFAAISDPEGQRLLSRWDLSIAPSASALAHARLRHRPSRPDETFVAFASDRGLPLTGEEATAMAEQFGGNGLAQSLTKATFEQFRAHAQDAEQLLITTRGVYSEFSSHDTYLELVPTPGVHDSRLSATEITGILLSAELVVLAACDTARGRALLSDDRLDLTRAFLIAGSAAVMATRWKVPESPATTRFLLDFFRAYRRGGLDGGPIRKDEALTAARRKAIERGDPAQIWASWILIGDGR